MEVGGQGAGGKGRGAGGHGDEKRSRKAGVQDRRGERGVGDIHDDAGGGHNTVQFVIDYFGIKRVYDTTTYGQRRGGAETPAKDPRKNHSLSYT